MTASFFERISTVATSCGRRLLSMGMTQQTRRCCPLASLSCSSVLHVSSLSSSLADLKQSLLHVFSFSSSWADLKQALLHVLSLSNSLAGGGGDGSINTQVSCSFASYLLVVEQPGCWRRLVFSSLPNSLAAGDDLSSLSCRTAWLLATTWIFANLKQSLKTSRSG